MNMLLSLGLVLVGAAYTQAVVCKGNTDCGADECCYIKPEFEVVSRREQRQAVLPLTNIHAHHDTGVCQKYRLQHDNCNPMETANGHCGCGAGMSCQFVPAATAVLPVMPVDPTIVAPSKRRSIFMPGPGSFQCVCQKFRLEHDHCSPLETANGHCGCGAGMTCQFVADPTTAMPLVAKPIDIQTVSKRKIFFPGPGAYQCEHN